MGVSGGFDQGFVALGLAEGANGQADGHTRHFVLPKAAARKGDILEISALAGQLSRNSA